MENNHLDRSYDLALNSIAKAAATARPSLGLQETGKVMTIGAGIATVSGLPGAGLDELLQFPGNLYGIAFDLDQKAIGAVLLDDYRHLNTGDAVQRTGRVMDVPVGQGLIGRVIDPLGRPLDGNGPIVCSRRWPIERNAPAIMDRAPVTVPLQTGIKLIDALIPIGRGQRELILGDRQTGKTAIAVDTILNQGNRNNGSGTPVLCIYCAIRQQAAGVARIVAQLREKGAMDYTTVVVTEGNDPPGLAYIAPYAATSIAEYFMGTGRDVLVVYDDLTKHARAYREISLLLRRPPGREAYPGDIFYIHSRLLERATCLQQKAGGGSLTALPIVETEAQNMAAYIPTNLISITDGQVYLSPTHFGLGLLPAIDIGKSVSRVGGAAQLPAYHHVTGSLKLGYSQFAELETFARFGTRLDDHTRQVLARGQRIRALLKQPENAPLPVLEQIVLLLALTEGCFDGIGLEDMAEAEIKLLRCTAKLPSTLTRKLLAGEKMETIDKLTILTLAREALQP